jgi:serine/threonine-protein kinase
MTWENAQAYVKQLNRERYAGFSDWRLPTIEELASLLEPMEKNGDLYIDPVFVPRQKWCWSADKVASAASRAAWYVDFHVGRVYGLSMDDDLWVRVVRSRQ